MKKLFFLLASLSLFLTFQFSFAAEFLGRTRSTQDSVAAKFLNDANDSTTQLYSTIAQLNKDATDGRNPQGSIPTPVKAQDFKVVNLSYEKITNPWHYAQKTDQTCTTSDELSKYLVLLNSQYYVHMAIEKEKVLFSVETKVALSRDILHNSTDSCDDPNGHYSPVKSQLEIDGFILSQIADRPM